MGRLFCAQSGRCEWCGEEIYRTRPTQRWMDYTGTYTCNEAPEGQWQQHKPKPWQGDYVIQQP